MKIIQFLSAATAFTIILLEIYSGVIQGPMWWIWPGGLVMSLLIALAQFLPEMLGGPKPVQSTVFGQGLQLIMILVIAFGASYFANHFGREVIPDLMKAQGWIPPTA